MAKLLPVGAVQRAGASASRRRWTSQGTSDYVLYSFTLIDPNTSDIVCQKSHEIKKQGLEDAAYR